MAKYNKFWSLFSFLLFFHGLLLGHPMPNSVVNFSFGEDKINLKIEVPLMEFAPAFKKDFAINEEEILTKYQKEVEAYFIQHTQIKSANGVSQPISVTHTEIQNTAYNFGAYKELVVELTCLTDKEFNNRDFIFDYDAVIHQVVTHFALIKIHQDFDNGITPEDSVVVSTIHLDVASNTIKPLSIKLEKGSKWKGISKMIQLGMHHIYTGLDHLLFVFMLIIISPLLVEDKKWTNFGGWTYTLKRLLKIISAFTVGHCITLFIFSFFSLNNFSKIIEITIALSIIITTFHVIKPLFYNREIILTFIFGLIHGSAFGITLNQWGIASHDVLLSLLGFNMGIELMQLVLVICCLPVIYLSKYDFYKYIRVGLACLTLFISTFWLIERVTEKPNKVTTFMESLIK